MRTRGGRGADASLVDPSDRGNIEAEGVADVSEGLMR